MTISEACKAFYPNINPETVREWTRRHFFVPKNYQQRPTREGSDLDEADVVTIGVLSAFNRCGGRIKFKPFPDGEGGFVDPPIQFDESGLSQEALTQFRKGDLRGRGIQIYLELLQYRVVMVVDGRLHGPKQKPTWCMKFAPLEHVHMVAQTVLNSEAGQTFCILNCHSIWQHVQSMRQST